MRTSVRIAALWFALLVALLPVVCLADQQSLAAWPSAIDLLTNPAVAPAPSTPPIASADLLDVVAAKARAVPFLHGIASVDADSVSWTVTRPENLNWQVPPEWWAGHRERPWKYVALFWDGDGIGESGWVGVLQANPADQWRVVSWGFGY